MSNKAGLEIIDVLRPKPSPYPFIRIGGDKDGAYLLPDDLQGIKACFSPGVSNRKDFEDELFDRYGIRSHMCDFSSDIGKLATPLKPGQTFKKKWLDVNGAGDSISLEDWVSELAPDASDDLILQMDIEGAEYRNLLNTPESILRRFRIIVIELHGLNVCKHADEFNKELGPLLVILDRHFVCVHAHPNNCCGDFVLKGLDRNIPNVHELTFLRRDRWGRVADENRYPPLLPHPLDIRANVPNKPPLFLNEHWLEAGVRSNESTIKMLGDQVDYLSLALQRGSTSIASPKLVTDLHQLARYAASALPALSAMPNAGELIEVADGKKFVLSSKHAASPNGDVVMEKHPFFFHTCEGRNQFITIDLECEHKLFELRIKNRTDVCKERASCLFYSAHNDPAADLQKGFPVEVDEAFLTKTGAVSATNLRGCTARYLTVYSPEDTFLHLSAIHIMGLPCG